MPIFKTTKNILTEKDSDELFHENWMDRNSLYLPPKKDWDYKRPMNIEDVDIWEVIYESGGSFGLYAAWSPYAEFYMFTPGWFLLSQGHGIETYYGINAGKKVYYRMKDFGIDLTVNKLWIDDEKIQNIKNITSSLYIP